MADEAEAVAIWQARTDPPVAMDDELKAEIMNWLQDIGDVDDVRDFADNISTGAHYLLTRIKDSSQ